MQSKLDFAIVPAGPGDAADLAQVHVRSWRETYPGILPQAHLDRLSVPIHARRWRARLEAASDIVLVAESAEGLVGFCSGDWAHWSGKERTDAEIHTLYVLRFAQGLGLGTRLFTSTARALAARGAQTITVGVLRDNLPARAFYERLGGVCEGERVEWVGGVSVPAVDYHWDDLSQFTD
jgi:ribosomal protein S18 acetylase RimI-like enzyme